MIKTSEVRALIDRINHEGTVEQDALYAGLQRLERQEVLGQTVFDIADEYHGVGQSGWPEMGRWTDADQGKDTQEAHVDL